MPSVDYPAPDTLEAKAYDGEGLTVRESSPEQVLGTRKAREDSQGPAKKKLRRDLPAASQIESHHVIKRQDGSKKIGLPGRNLLEPSYKIKNAVGALSNRTIYTDLIQHGGYTQYDTHNL